MKPSSYQAELPVNSLDLSDLLMRFKVMKALGYHSLFDEGLQKELRNPFRKLLYYKLVSAEEAMETVKMYTALKNAADRVGFYSNPELANKVRRSEEQAQMDDAEYAEDEIAKRQKEFDRIRKLRGDI